VQSRMSPLHVEVSEALPRSGEYSEPKPRIETLSDLIFGLALSVGAFSLISNLPTDPEGIAIDVVLFGFSFLVLISVWMRYTAIMSVLPVENRTTILLNVALLFLVSIEPYAFNLVSLVGHFHVTELDNYASTLYSLDMAGLMMILAFFAHELTIEERGIVSPERAANYKWVRTILFVSTAVYFVTILPLFWTATLQELPLRFYFWVVALLISWLASAYRLPKEGKVKRTSKR